MTKHSKIDQSLSRKIIEAMCYGLNSPKKKVYLHETKFIGNELLYLKECVDNVFV